MANSLMGYPVSSGNQCYVLCLLPGENGLSFQPQLIHPGLGQLGLPQQLFEGGIPQLDAFNPNSGAKFFLPSEIPGLSSQTTTAEYLNEQFGLRQQQPEVLTATETQAKQQKMQEEQSQGKGAKQIEKASPLDANILKEKEMQKATAAERIQATKSMYSINKSILINVPFFFRFSKRIKFWIRRK